MENIKDENFKKNIQQSLNENFLIKKLENNSDDFTEYLLSLDYLNNKNRFKLYYENNKDKFKEYYNNNKDKIREYNHKYWIHSHKCNYKRCIVNKQIQPPVPKISDKPIIVTFGFK